MACRLHGRIPPEKKMSFKGCFTQTDTGVKIILVLRPQTRYKAFLNISYDVNVHLVFSSECRDF